MAIITNTTLNGTTRYSSGIEPDLCSDAVTVWKEGTLLPSSLSSVTSWGGRDGVD